MHATGGNIIRRRRRRCHQSSSALSWWQSLGCIMGRGKMSAKRQGAPSPDKTALISRLDEEEQEEEEHNQVVSNSSGSPFLFHNSRSADSFDDYTDRLPGFAMWESPATSFSQTFDGDTDGESMSKEEEVKWNKSLQSLLKSNRYRVPMDEENNIPTLGKMLFNKDDSSIDSDNETHHFSTSTQTIRSTFNTRISVTESGVLPPPSDRSECTSHSSFTKGSRVSLDHFLAEERKVVQTSIMNLGEISALDMDSVNSGMMTVSYDEDYPQLVMQRSHDGSTRWSSGTIGATYPHPAADNGSVKSWDTAKKKVSCTPQWLEAQIDMVWKEIDCENEHESTTCAENEMPLEALVDVDDDDDDVDDDEAQEDDEEGATVEDDNEDAGTSEEDEDDEDGDSDSDNEVDNNSTEDSRTDLRDRSIWKHNVKVNRSRSFPPDSCVGELISDMIGANVLEPMLRPICHFVDSIEIPEPASRNVRHPLSENGANIK